MNHLSKKRDMTGIYGVIAIVCIVIGVVMIVNSHVKTYFACTTGGDNDACAVCAITSDTCARVLANRQIGR